MAGVSGGRWQRSQIGHPSFLSYPQTMIHGGNKEELHAIIAYLVYLVSSERNAFYLKQNKTKQYMGFLFSLWETCTDQEKF